jgi:FixJ family two-component response regulator
LSRVPTVAVIHHDEAVRREVEKLVRGLGFGVELFPSPVKFILHGHALQTACLIVDVELSELENLELRSHLAAGIPIIFIIAGADEETVLRALRAGAFDFQQKPEGERAFVAALLSKLKSRAGGSR